MGSRKKCLIIDGNNLVYRSYYAAQKLVWLGERKEIYIFLKIFISLLRKENYQKIFLVFDKAKRTFRNELNKDYKMQREKTPEPIIKHLREVQALIKSVGLQYSESENFEADDLIASFVKKFADHDDFDFHILSQDKDLFQLLRNNVKLLRYRENKLELFGIEAFESLFRFSHLDFKYYLSLIGDKVDNIKGIKGIGEKRANYIVSNFGNLENTFLQMASLPKELQMLISGKREEIESNGALISLVENIDLEEWEHYDFSKKALVENPKLIDFCQQNQLTNFLLSLNGTQNRTRTDTE